MTIIDMDKMGEALNTKADIDLNNTGVFSTSEGGVVNLTSSTPANASGKEVTSADFFQSNLLNYTTNRILEIPRDIKLEIDSNGKCWLKAGSKCYKPNGTVINIVNDIAVGRTTTVQEFIGVTGDGLRVGLNVQPSRCYSGATAPTGFSGYGLWLDTNSMTYKFSLDGGSTWNACDYSLPIALVTMKNVDGEVASIDQVFNGFGYIGSTVFALPDVKCQFAVGRNSDGSYKSYVKTTDRVLTLTFGSDTFNGFDCSLACTNNTIDRIVWHVNEDFDAKSGYIKINKTNEIQENICPVFRLFINSSADNGRISQFIVNPVDKLNWKTTEISGLGMPSSKYVDLTLGASPTNYVAPANGWFVVNSHLKDGKWLTLWNDSNKFRVEAVNNLNLDVVCYMPAKAGDAIELSYEGSINTQSYQLNPFVFIYAEGDQ